jgi:hypothetical protein
VSHNAHQQILANAHYLLLVHLVCKNRAIRWNVKHWTSGVKCTQQKLQSICAVLTCDPQLKKILTFSVKKNINSIILFVSNLLL